MMNRVQIIAVDPTTRSGKIQLFLGNLQNFLAIAFAGGLVLIIFTYAALQGIGVTDEVNQAFTVGLISGIWISLCFYITFVQKIFIQEIRQDEPEPEAEKKPRRRTRSPGPTVAISRN